MLVTLALLAWVAGCGRAAAPYPNKPITIVAPFSAGGGSDVAARALATVAPRYIGQSVVVANRTGAGGVVGTDFVKNARRDGYTLLMARIGSHVIIPAVDPNSPYEWHDFTILSIHELNPFVFAVRSDSPYTTFSALIAALKERPGSLSYATSGPATLLNFGPQLLFHALGLGAGAAVMVPFQGGAEAATAVVGGHVDFVGNNLSEISNQLKNKQVRVLAVTSPERVPLLPDVPTVRELNYPNLEQIVGWSALAGPPELPADVLAKWHEALPKIANDPEWRTLVERSGSIPFIRPPDESRTFIAEQFNLYEGLAQRLGLVR